MILDVSMPAPVSETMLTRLLEVARHKVVAGMATLTKPAPGGALQLAEDLHAIAGEASLLERPELSRAALEGEDAVRLLAQGRTGAVEPCMRSLRRLGYLLQEASDALQDDTQAARKHSGKRTAKLLVVDDSPVAAMALADVFEMHDYTVRVASTMDKAIELFKTFAPDVLVSDVHMPVLDVAELCRRFRASAADRRAAIVLVSGRSESELHERLTEIRPEVFVSKLSGAVAVVTQVNAVCRDLFA
jgi:CheY-like chemotaxis protein